MGVATLRYRRLQRAALAPAADVRAEAPRPLIESGTTPVTTPVLPALSDEELERATRPAGPPKARR